MKRSLGILAALVVILVLPLVIRDRYVLHLLTMSEIAAFLAVGVTLLLGVAGQVSLGQAGFYAVGAYTSALLTTRLGWPVWLTLPAAGGVAASVALALGPVFRLRGHFLAVATAAFGEIVRLVIINWSALTNGPRGIIGIPPPRFGSWAVESVMAYYYLVLAFLAATLWVAVRLRRGRLGRAWRALGGNPEAAEASGVPVTALRAFAFALAAFPAGLAGSLYAHFVGFVSPHTFTFEESVRILAMAVLGGLGSFGGGVGGAVALTLLPEFLRPFEQYRLLVLSGLLLVILIFFPRGLAGLWERQGRTHG